MKALKILFLIKLKLRFYENICGTLRHLSPFAKACNFNKSDTSPKFQFISYTLLILKLQPL